MEKVYNKLVRDFIPEIIHNNNQKPIIRVLNDEEYKKQLEIKLKEEYEEVLAASGIERIEELADMLEVIRALTKLENKTLEDVLLIADKKAQKRGAFDKKVFLEKVIESE